MGVIISGRYIGGLKVENVHGPSGAILTTAAPVDNAGDGSSFSPTDLFATSLASCILTTVAIKADTKGIDLHGSHYVIEKIMQKSPRRVAELRLQLRFPAALSDSQRKLVEAIANTCPVHKSIDPLVVISIDFVYDI